MKSHYASELGKLSVKKRPQYIEKLRAGQRKRWQNYVHPKTDALLELSRREDLTKLNMVEIADLLGLQGRSSNKAHTAKRLVEKLQQQGLLPAGIGAAYSRASRELIALSQTQDLTQLSIEEIADRIGLSGPWKNRSALAHITKLVRKGLLSPWGTKYVFTDNIDEVGKVVRALREEGKTVTAIHMSQETQSRLISQVHEETSSAQIKMLFDCPVVTTERGRGVEVKYY